MAVVTCKICKTKIEKETAYNPKKGFYYCNKEELEEKVTKEKTDWQLLMDRLNILYNYNCNFPLCCSQIKSMKSNLGFKDKAILYTINYMVDIEGINWKEDDGLGLIPYYYKKAQGYFQESVRLKKEINEFNFEDKKRIKKPPFIKNKTIQHEKIDIGEL